LGVAAVFRQPTIVNLKGTIAEQNKAIDPCADIILDPIAQPESGGDYNAVVGKAGATASLADLLLEMP